MTITSRSTVPRSIHCELRYQALPWLCSLEAFTFVSTGTSNKQQKTKEGDYAAIMCYRIESLSSSSSPPSQPFQLVASQLGEGFREGSWPAPGVPPLEGPLESPGPNLPGQPPLQQHIIPVSCAAQSLKNNTTGSLCSEAHQALYLCVDPYHLHLTDPNNTSNCCSIYCS